MRLKGSNQKGELAGSGICHNTIMDKFFLAMMLIIACFSAQAKKQAIKIAPAFLIVPGKSIGKVAIGDEQKDVHKKMGSPSAFSRKAKAEIALHHEDYPDFDQWTQACRQSSRDVIVEVWIRPKETGCFKVVYERGIVRQISTSLSGYTTLEGLSVSSGFVDFEKKYKNPRTFDYVLVEDEQLGFSPTLETLKDYVSDGLSLFSDVYFGPEPPAYVDTVIVHQAGVLALEGYGIPSRIK